MMYLPFTHPLATTTDFVVQRQLQITYDDDCPACYRQLHESQADLPDEALQCFPCIFQDDFALITEGHILDPVLEEQCNDIGLVRAVCYSIFSSPGMQHVADTYTAESAEQLVSLLTQTAIKASRMTYLAGDIHSPGHRIPDWFTVVDSAYRSPGLGSGAQALTLPRTP